METHAHELLGEAIMAGKPAVIFGRGDRPVNFVAVLTPIETFVRERVEAARSH